jgi:two-component system chemotaxis response regulator CheB
MIKVLIVDDSALVRKTVSAELSKYDDIEVVGTAVDPYVARDKIVALNPDVITLDLEMPRMDGLSFLAKLMKYHPMPVIVLSSLVPVAHSEAAIRALALGAVEVLPKNTRYSTTEGVNRALVRAIRAAAQAVVRRPEELVAQPSAVEPLGKGRMLTTHKVIAIGASTGGPPAIEAVLKQLPPDCPGIVIVQHMPAGFVDFFAKRLDEICPMEVRMASDGDAVVPGLALIAPGDKHTVMESSGSNYTVRLKDGPAVFHQRPSVDVMFRSVAHSAGRNVVAVLLTGMGLDGAQGLLEIRQQGGRTIAQDEASCIIFGMPAEAIKLGAAEKVVSLPSIAGAIIDMVTAPPSSARPGPQNKPA